MVLLRWMQKITLRKAQRSSEKFEGLAWPDFGLTLGAKAL